MNYKAFIKSALASLGLPVFFQRYSGTAETYITFFRVGMQDSEWAGNDSIAWTHYFQVDLWSKLADTGTLVYQIISLMEAAGCKHETVQDLYEDDTKISHFAISFNFLEEGDL